MSTSIHQSGQQTNQGSRARADELRKNNQFEEASAEYALIWPDGDKWTGWGYAHCLRKAGHAKEALGVARDLYKLDPEFRLGRSVYAWALYDSVIRGAETINAHVLEAAELIVSLANDVDAYSATSAYSITVLLVAKLWSQKQRDVHVLEWLKKLDPSRLGTDPGKGTDERGKDRELASRRERYYSLLTHAFERLGRWQECLDMSTKAISDCGALHHDNDIWFARRIALAKQKLGMPKEAVEELQHLAERKQASFLHSDIASAAWDAGDIQAAFKHALNALVAPQDISFKLDAVRLIAEILWQRDEKDHARRHIQLCVAVRAARGWSVSTDLSTLGANWQVVTTKESASTIQRELEALWKKWLDELVPRKLGAVTRILPNGHAGFIKSNEHQDFYFDAHDWKGRRSAMAEGVHVSFATRQGFDRKRQRSTTVACDIRVVST